MLKEGATREDFGESLRSAMDRIEQMSEEKQANWRKLIYFLLLLIYNRRERSEHNEFFNIIETRISEKTRREEVQRMSKTFAQELIEEGEAIGEKRGIVIAKQEDLTRLLRGKFGLISQGLIEKIKLIQQADKLDDLFDRAITAETINDVGIE